MKDADSDVFGCADLCIQQGWTVGDVSCINDAPTQKAAKDCAVIAKLMLVHNEQKTAQAALLKAQQQKDEEQKRLQRDLAEQNAKIERLLADLTAAKDEAQRAEIQKKLEEAQAEQRRLKAGGSAPTSTKTCACAPGDPLCSCL